METVISTGLTMKMIVLRVKQYCCPGIGYVIRVDASVILFDHLQTINCIQMFINDYSKLSYVFSKSLAESQRTAD
jgi:hypothetical protein